MSLVAGPSSRSSSAELLRFLPSRPFAALFAIFALSCNAPEEQAVEPSHTAFDSSLAKMGQGPTFVAEPRVDFSYYNGGSGHYYFPEVMGAGVALLDYDFDGDLDLFLPQGSRLEPAASGEAWMAPPEEPGDRLFRLDLGPRDSGLELHDVTAEAGIAPSGYGLGAAVGDVDGNGYPDVYSAHWGPDRLWLNRGDGRFEKAQGMDDDGWSAGATFFDFDRDGDLDLYLVRYVRYQIGDASCLTDAGGPDYCGPLKYPGVSDRLYRNRGDGTFEDVSLAAGFDGTESRGMSAVAADFDGDGWTDLFVTSDSTENHLWINLGDGTFEDRALESGCAMNFLGAPEASMGIAVGDLDDNGTPDILATHLFAETNTLYLNDGFGLFRDASLASGLGAPSLNFTTFGIALLDADHDGALDLVTSSGLVRVPPALSGGPDPFPLQQRLQLFMGQGGGKFEELEDEGSPFAVKGVGRGLAAGDWEGDGDLDVVVVMSNGPLRMLRNDLEMTPSWIAFRADHDRFDRLLGARVTLRQEGSPTRYRWLHRDGSYGSSSESIAHFGLGSHRAHATLEVRPTKGPPLRFTGLAPGKTYRWAPAAE